MPPTNIDYAFSIKDRVHITALNTDGVVVALFTGETGNQYSVRYTYNGESKSVYFYEFELERAK